MWKAFVIGLENQIQTRTKIAEQRKNPDEWLIFSRFVQTASLIRSQFAVTLCGAKIHCDTREKQALECAIHWSEALVTLVCERTCLQEQNVLYAL